MFAQNAEHTFVAENNAKELNNSKMSSEHCKYAHLISGTINSFHESK